MLAAALLMLVPAAAPEDKNPLSADAQKELKKLEGEWKAVKLMFDGNEKAPEEELIVGFAGNKMTVRQGDNKDRVVELEVTAVDPSTTPRCIDFKSLTEKGGRPKGTVIEGNYKLD